LRAVSENAPGSFIGAFDCRPCPALTGTHQSRVTALKMHRNCRAPYPGKSETTFHSPPSWFGSWSLCVPSIKVFALGGRYPARTKKSVAGQGDCAVVDGLVSLGPLPQYSAFMSAGHQICPPPARSQPGNSPSPHLGHWKLSQHPIHETMHLSHCIDLAAHGSQAAKLPRYSNPNSSVCPFLISRFWISKNRSGFASLLSPRN
jgi:hypothetical protein